MRKMQRPRLTLKVLFYAIFDVVGMVAFATGATWLARDQTLFFRDFPSGTAQAVLVLLGGIALMLWAAAQIVRELIKQPQPAAEGHADGKNGDAGTQ